MPKPPAKGQRVRSTALKDPSKGRIRPALKEAIHLMATQGLARKEAAKAVGMTDHSLYTALCKPHVQAFKNRVLREFREGTAERAYVRVAELGEQASSEHVKLDANKTLLSLDKRYVAAVKTIHEGTVNHVVTPGYVIDLGDQPIAHPLDDRGIIEEYQDTSPDHPT